MKDRCSTLQTPVKIFLCLCITLFYIGCNSDEDIVKDDPYGGGKEPYGIKLLTVLPSPDKAYPGDEVIYQAKGLSKWFDENGKAKFEFFISNEKAEIVGVSDSTIKVKVPENLSSGIAHILLGEQIFYGPKLTVLGNVSVDNGYILSRPISGPIYDYLEHYDTKTKDHYHWVGDFRVYRDDGFVSLINSIAWIDNKGTVTTSWNNNYYNIDSEQGIRYDLNNPNSDESGMFYAKSISYFNNDKTGDAPNVLISGKFTLYDPVERFPAISVNNIMKVEHNMASIYDEREMLSSRTGRMEIARIARFNGGTKEAPVATFITSDDNVIAVGNITQYCSIDIERSYSDDWFYVFTSARTVLKMNNIGELEQNYRKGKSGVEGSIQDAYMDEDDGVVVVGDFGTFDGTTAHNIIRLDKNGEIDAQYLQNIGTGANGIITKVRYNKNKKKAMIVGSFTEFNGKKCSGVTMLNSDGTIDPAFNLRKMEGGLPNFACLLDNHDIVVVSGTFKKYDGISRQGFLMLNIDGNAMQKFNVPGMFSGELNHVIETKTSTNDNGLLLLGDFYRFNGEYVSNEIKIEVDFD